MRRAALALGWFVGWAAGCIGPRGFVCESDDVCRLDGAEGICAEGWCAYPDDDCDGRYRFESRAGDGLAGACVESAGSTGIATTTSSTSSGSGDGSSGDEIPPWDCDQQPCSVRRLVLGRNHTCLTDDAQTLWCWGHNEWGQLGRGTNSFAESCPEPVVSDALGELVLAGAADHTCILDDTAKTYCWGRNDDGQADPTSAEPVVSVPTEVEVTPAMLETIDLGASLSCGTDGTLVLCLGDVDATDNPGPLVVDAMSPILHLATGGRFACVATDNGRVSCVGDDSVEQLGDGPGQSPNAMNNGVGIAIASSSSHTIEALDAGPEHTCAVVHDEVSPGLFVDDVRCWGNNDTGQCGAPSDLEPVVDAPTSVPMLVGKAYSQLSLGRRHSCVLVDDGRVQCWGDNSDGQVSPTVPTTSPDYGAHVVELVEGEPLLAVEVRTGDAHTCARTAQGRVWCWGNADYGQLGPGTEGAVELPLSCN